jgi:predicted Co/Zn/Cd cation transporter (cation efflux family)
MRDPRVPFQRLGLTAIDGSMALIVLLLLVQMYLLTATLEAYLAGHHDAALPGVILSGLLFAACAALYVFVERLDREARKG